MSEATPGLVAELWYAEPVDLARPDLLAALREIAPDAEAQADSIVVPHAAPLAGRPPLLTTVLPASDLVRGGKQKPDVTQTWDWPGAGEAVEASRTALLVAEMFADTSDPEERVSAIGAVVGVLTRLTDPLLVSWPHSQRVVDPHRAVADDLDGVLNVRMFSDADDEAVLVMDTLGLDLFGRPDVQCHFRDRSPGEIAAMLHATAVYLFENGDVIADGNTITAAVPGLSEANPYVCHRELAMVGPTRWVLDVDLGDPYAAGERDR